MKDNQSERFQEIVTYLFIENMSNTFYDLSIIDTTRFSFKFENPILWFQNIIVI